MFSTVTNVFSKCYDIWYKHGFIILVGLALFAFFIYWLFFTRNNENGTYSDSYFYDPFSKKMPKVKTTDEKYQQPKQQGGDSKGERICRAYLEKRFQKRFDKARPKYMFNSVTGKPLEFDCFNKELLLACEYNGKQHYEYVPFFHKSRADFQNQKYRDIMKKDICNKLGVRLIEVPYTIKNEEIPAYIDRELKKLNL